MRELYLLFGFVILVAILWVFAPWLLIVCGIALIVLIIIFIIKRCKVKAHFKKIKSDYIVDYTIPTKVVGVTFNGIQKIIPTLKSGMKIVLLREKNNSYDRNAIAVYCIGKKIGHINADLAERLAPLMDNSVPIDGEIHSITGGRGGNYGCNIEIVVYKLKGAATTHKPSASTEGIPKISDLTCQVENIDKSNPLFEKTCVLIGFGYDRSNIAQSIINLGGVIRSTVSGKTDFVMMKTPQFLEGNSGNILKLKELMENGGKVKIMYPEEFEKIVNEYLK